MVGLDFKGGHKLTTVTLNKKKKTIKIEVHVKTLQDYQLENLLRLVGQLVCRVARVKINKK